MTRRLTTLAAFGLVALVGCSREDRRFRESPPSAPPNDPVRISTLQPGPMVASSHVVSRYDGNAFASSEGQRLFNWYNCSGCHANGGGGMGPPLMDDKWIYGSAPENVYETIMQGRPNGMPSFKGRIPSQQAWQIVSYVRQLSSLTPMTTRSARTEHMMSAPGSPVLEHGKKPQQSFNPPASEMP
jgi:cytochrome c oxidase cbb3-type subunit 3